MSGSGHNNPPVIIEFTSAEAEFLSQALDNEMAVGLNILQAVQEGTFSQDAAEKVAAKMEAMRPILKKFKEALK